MPMIKFEPTTSTSCVVGSDHSVNVVQQFLLFFKDVTEIENQTTILYDENDLPKAQVT